MDFGIIDLSGLELQESGEEEFNGSDLPYEEYGAAKSTAAARLFVDEGRLVGMRFVLGDETADITVLSLDQNIPVETFEIPEDYEQSVLD
jgi:hypothetical protein